MENEQLYPSIVRIRATTSEATVGVGVLITDKDILTCAHVVAIALYGYQDVLEQPTDKVRIDFPFVAPGQISTAQVRNWRSIQISSSGPPVYGEDIAKLELDDAPPQGARPALLQTADLSRHSFDTFGFPADHNINGTWTSGELMGRVANGWYQVQGVREQGYPIEPGFSGAPVWDRELEAVVGIVVAADMERPEYKVGFIIPTDVLSMALSKLEIKTLRDSLSKFRDSFVQICITDAAEGEIGSDEWGSKRVENLATALFSYVGLVQDRTQEEIQKLGFGLTVPPFEPRILNEIKEIVDDYCSISETNAETIARLTNYLLPLGELDLVGGGLLGALGMRWSDMFPALVQKIKGIDAKERALYTIRDHAGEVFTELTHDTEKYLNEVKKLLDTYYWHGTSVIG
jgi:V8-like Glu-specific endopeptidase